MSSDLFKKVSKEFWNSSCLEDYKAFFKTYDVWIMIVPIIRLQDKKMWRHLWTMIFQKNTSESYQEFLSFLRINNLLGESNFLDFMDKTFEDIISGKGLEFNEENDLSIVLSDKPLKELLCFCKTIPLHSGKGVKEFTQETCRESLYYYRATKQNNYASKITFNTMMREVCESFLDFLEEKESFFLKNFISLKYVNKKVLYSLKHSFLSREPIQYLVLDDFLNKRVFEEVQKTSQNFQILDHRKEHFISNKTAYIYGKKFEEIYNFFQSKAFMDFAQYIYGKVFDRYSKIDMDKLRKNISIKKSGAIAQVYEKGDYMSWHTDIAKDMRREELIEKGGYQLWDTYNLESFEEVGAFIYYIDNSDNENWDTSYGGNLELGKIEKNSMKSYKVVPPKKNRLVFIKSSNYSYHRVSKVLKDHYRISFQDLFIHYKRPPDESTRHIYY